MERVHPRLPISSEELKALCQRWKIREFALFGSAVREDFRPDSDIDVMVDFEKDAGWSLWDFVELQLSLQDLLGRDVDLVEKGTIQNPYRAASISRDLTVLYAA